jgi:hypothetical protein
MLALGEVDKLVVSSTGDSVFIYLHKDAVIPVSRYGVFNDRTLGQPATVYCISVCTHSFKLLLSCQYHPMQRQYF